jgi:hypothetical protein
MSTLLFQALRFTQSPKEKPPPFPVRVVQYKAPGGDLLQLAICDRGNNRQRKTPTVSGEGCSV